MNPAAPGSYDWAFQVGGWALGALALLLLVWTIWRGRARGRLRCPKCWYDVASLVTRDAGGSVPKRGSPLVTCPECGRQPTKRRQLKRTQIGRWWVIAAIIAGLGAWVLGRSMALKSEGWTALVPTSVLIFVAPANDPTGGVAASPAVPSATALYLSMNLSPPPPPKPPMPTPPRLWHEKLGDAAWGRLRTRQMWRWQSSAFLERHFAAVGSHPRNGVHAPPEWPAGLPVPMLIEPFNIAGAHALNASGRTAHMCATAGVLGEARAVSVGKRPRAELEFGVGDVIEWVGTANLDCTVREKAEQCVQVVNDQQVIELLGDALALRLGRIGNEIVVACDERREAGAWSRINFVAGLKIQLVIGGRVVATGSHFVPQATSPLANWVVIPLSWEPGEQERYAEISWKKPIEAAFLVTPDFDAIFTHWWQWDFTIGRPRAFSGQFSRPAYLQTHPSISPPLPPKKD